MATEPIELLTESHLKIYVTKNYALFHPIKGNRPINEGNKRSKTKAMEEIGREDFGMPILVDRTFGVGDGQHRLEARMAKNWPIYFMVDSKLTLREIQVMNSAQVNWKMSDYIYSLSEMGNENYTRFLELYNKYSKQFGVYALLGLCSQDSVKAVQRGEMELSEEKIEEVTILCNKLLAVQAYFKDATKIKFCRAYKKALQNEDFKHEYFLTKLAAKREEMYSCTRPEQYLVLIEKIYNFNKKSGVIELVPKMAV